MATKTFDIGGTDTVSRLGFGAMRLCGPDVLGEPADVGGARRVLERAVDLGVDLVDTADAYGPGTSERLVGETIDAGRDDLVVATKGGLLRTPDGDWLPRADPDHLHNALLCSLDRLQVDRVDLYQLHRPDPDVPFIDSVTALAGLKDRGLVDHVGLSNVSVDQLDRAREVVEIATVQNQYSVVDRESDDVVEACDRAGIGFLPWYPLGAGDLSERGDALDTVAKRHGASRHQVALAWLLHRSPVVLPIPGTSSVGHLERNVEAASIELSADDLDRLA